MLNLLTEKNGKNTWLISPNPIIARREYNTIILKAVSTPVHMILQYWFVSFLISYSIHRKTPMISRIITNIPNIPALPNNRRSIPGVSSISSYFRTLCAILWSRMALYTMGTPKSANSPGRLHNFIRNSRLFIRNHPLRTAIVKMITCASTTMNVKKYCREIILSRHTTPAIASSRRTSPYPPFR